MVQLNARKIADLLRKQGKTANAVSLAAFGNRDSLRQILAGNQKNTTPQKARMLADELGVTVEYLYDQEDEEPVAKDLVKPGSRLDRARETVQVPEHDVRISAGGGEIIAAETVRRTWGLPRPFLESMNLDPRRVAFVEIIGDSMSPTLNSGDLVLLDLQAVNPTIPAIYALFDGDATVCKRVERLLRSDPPMLRLTSDNPAYRSYEVPAEWARIIGRVAWFARRI